MTTLSFVSLGTDQGLLDQVYAAIDGSELSDRQKRVFKRRMQWRPRVRQAVMDEVIAQGFAEEVFIPEISDSGDVTVQVDWDSIADFLERILPLILQIIGLFG